MASKMWMGKPVLQIPGPGLAAVVIFWTEALKCGDQCLDIMLAPLYIAWKSGRHQPSKGSTATEEDHDRQEAGSANGKIIYSSV
ncbi:hypothetical protein ACJ73_05677 [Blastomyces percursus]|uniref:Uncharacterized protein n=1 Tax=Blastomyces percursus TaxID=1658174 RepID=A0A1J9R5S2_9EURO|nr:hypothetical protein ACJ73_05677 [Blastomyces percursus]